MTAADAYKAAIDAQRARILAKIKDCARSGEFSVRIYKDKNSFRYIDAVIDELTRDGFKISSSDPDTIDVSWEHADGNAFNQ